MKSFINFLFPQNLWTRQTIVFGGGLFFKFILFNIIWCQQTTFTSFSFPELYLNAALATLVLLIPYACFHRGWLQLVIMFILDGLLIANLMYSRTYYSAIPLDSYGLAGNLSDFTASVYDSLRWADLLFPLATLICAYLFITEKNKLKITMKLHYLATLSVVLLLSIGLNISKGGYKTAYDSLQNANYHTCGVPMYTIFGHLYYNTLQKEDTYTPQVEEVIRSWQAEQPAYKPLPENISTRTNLVVILCESLESWVLERKVEGHEITPCLNALLKDSTTLFAPKVLTQVAGGRSIDCQLLLNARMLPIKSGSYSMKYPNNTFFTLTKALKKKYGARGYLLTVDKQIVWNQGAVAKAFGIDTLLTKPCWILDEKIGSRKKLGDESFFRQCVEKLKRKEIWKENEPVYFQCVTYSGHNPFILPEESKHISFKENYPQRMKDYMCMANYTDHAIKQFIDYLKTRSDYDRTLVVITGDHEGLAADREPLCHSAKGKGIVSDKPFTPLIIVNSPVAMRYEKVMGQVDIYTTILNLMKLDDYLWKGIGQSILDPDKPPFAIGSQMNSEGDTQHISVKEREHAEKAYTISDLMIRYNYLSQQANEK